MRVNYYICVAEKNKIQLSTLDHESKFINTIVTKKKVYKYYKNNKHKMVDWGMNHDI